MSDDDPRAVEQFYGILAFIPEGSDFNFDEAVRRCQRTFPRREVQTAEQGKNKAILIVAKRWEVLAVLVDQPHVAEESREMAEWHREHPQASKIAGCRRRVEFEGQTFAPAVSATRTCSEPARC